MACRASPRKLPLVLWQATGVPTLGDQRWGLTFCTQGRVSKALSEKCFISELISKPFEFLLKILFNDQFAKCLQSISFLLFGLSNIFLSLKSRKEQKRKANLLSMPFTPAHAHHTGLSHWPCPGNSGSQDHSGPARCLLPQFSQLHGVHSKLL